MKFDRLPLPIVGGGRHDRSMDLTSRRPLARALADYLGNARDHGERVSRLALAARLMRWSVIPS